MSPLLGLLLVAFCLLPRLDDEPAEKSPPKLKPIGQLRGEIVEITKDGRKFVLEVEGEMPYWSRSSSPRSRTPPKLKTKKQKFEIEVKLADEARVRLPLDADDEEAKQTKKDEKDKLPGRPGELGDLKKDQLVLVHFAQTPDKPPLIYGTLVLVLKDKLK